MNIAFYIDEMNVRGVANSTYDYAKYNKFILKNNSYIFYNKKNFRNKNHVLKRFKKLFKVIGISNFYEIDNFLETLKLNYVYTQKSGSKDEWVSNNIKTIIHSVYPQFLSQIHGYKYLYISEWLSENFSNKKIPSLPYIVEKNDIKQNLKKKLKINKNDIVFGCHGGESSFDLKFAQDTVLSLVKKRKNIIFVFLNINKFCSHPQIKFLKGTSNSLIKKKFINTCDAMIYGRSLGESFGLACGEFAITNKLIISYKFNRHKAHLAQISKNRFIEYSSRKSLFNILSKFDKKRDRSKKSKNKYLECTPKKIMFLFKKFLNNENYTRNLNILDYLINYINFAKIVYFYVRHKIYNHYYNFLEKKFFYNKD